MKKKSKKIVVGVSGGIDSIMALVLLKEKGWDPIGISLKFNKEIFITVKNVCKELKIPHYIIDIRKEFKKIVVGYFINELKHNKTPNPCMMCNRNVKFKYLFEWAKKHDINNVATGHYARIRKNKKTGEYELLKSKDKKKDQTYLLAFLEKEWLKNIVFPLGCYTKKEIYKIAKEKSFESIVEKKESQDFCFVSDNGIRGFLKKEIGEKNGLIKGVDGKILGKHCGLHFYTIGQRKGINLSGGPYFVVRKDAKKNILIVSKNKKDLLIKNIRVKSLNLFNEIEDMIKVMVKIRSQHSGVRAELVRINKDEIEIILNKKQKSVTPGQFAVFYKDNVCLGGGVIV